MGVSVRPSKRTHFCPGSGKHKIIFPSKEAADRFIYYNKDAIMDETGFAPIRSYYCESCGGWHVTSREKVHVDKEEQKLQTNVRASHKRQVVRAMRVRQQLERADLYLRHAQENLEHGLVRKSEKLFREAFRCLLYTMSSDCCQTLRAHSFVQMAEFYDRLTQYAA